MGVLEVGLSARAEVKSAAVFVTRELPGNALPLLQAAADVEVWPEEAPPPRDEILRRAPHVDALLTMLTDRIDATVLDAGARLRVVSNMAVGYDNIDVAAATARGILVANTPGVLTETTADMAFALLLAAARRVVEGDRLTRTGGWKTWHPSFLLGRDAHGAVLGIVGLGQIGLAVARRARGFNMRLLYCDIVRRNEAEKELGLEYVDLDRLLSQSDFVSVHVFLDAQSHHLIGERELALMKPGAVLVNTSRGAVVDQRALYSALKEGRIAAAGLDVSEIEPIPADDPLLDLDNVVITPHIASASVATREKMARMAVENIVAVLQGEMPAHCVNPEARRPA
ncbi:MAG: D-glycerate dehydrogenase [Dehalococcoidia bacterium]|nr:D-glycerate dehydrogenase [Dehalococcoidia bacterium]